MLGVFVSFAMRISDGFDPRALHHIKTKVRVVSSTVRYTSNGALTRGTRV